jgi:HEAT repeat protein
MVAWFGGGTAQSFLTGGLTMATRRWWVTLFTLAMFLVWQCGCSSSSSDDEKTTNDKSSSKSSAKDSAKKSTERKTAEKSPSAKKPATKKPAAGAKKPAEAPESEVSFEAVDKLLRQMAKLEMEDEDELEKLCDTLQGMSPECVPHVLKIAATTDHPATCEAIEVLAFLALDEHEEAARKLVVGALTDKNSKRRAVAIKTLYANEWPEATEARLQEILKKDPDSNIRARAVATIFQMETLTPGLWQMLCAALADQNQNVHMTACVTLRKLGEKVDPFHGDLHAVYRKGDIPVRDSALAALASCRLDAKDAAFLKTALDEPPGPFLTKAALKAACSLPPETPWLAEVGRKWLAEGAHEDERANAAGMIGLQKPVTEESVDRLVEAASDTKEEASVREAAISGLAHMGPAAVKAVDPLVALYSQPAAPRGLVALALSLIKPGHPLVQKHLTETLKQAKALGRFENRILNGGGRALFTAVFDDLAAFLRRTARDNPRAATDALLTVSTFGTFTGFDPSVKGRLAALLAELLDTKINARGRMCIYQTLLTLGDEAAVAVPQLRKALQTPKEDELIGVPMTVLQLLGQIGPKAKDALPEVRSLLKDESLQWLAAAVLIRIDSAATEEGLAMLRAGLTSKEELGQEWAAESLAAIGPTGKSLQPLLFPLKNSDTPRIYAAVQAALATTSGEYKPVIDQLIRDLQSKDSPRRLGACLGLVMLQRHAKDAVPALREAMTKDPEAAEYYGGAIFLITGEEPTKCRLDFVIPHGGYPW